MTKRRIERLGVREGYDRWSETYDATPNPLVALDETVVFEPVGCVSSAWLASDAPARSFDPFARRIALDERTRFTPVMKFVRSAAGYDVHRMTYRGDGGWSWPIASGRLATLATRYLRHIGTPKFFELD
jgi:hypothetical protein